MRILNELNSAMERVWFFRDRLAEKTGNSVLANQFSNETHKLSTLNKAVALIDRSIGATTLPAGITSIGTYAFRGCTSLALSTLPAGITSIGTYAFYGCTSLALSTLPAGITIIGAYAFYGCTSLALSTLPAGITSIGGYAFNGCISLALSTLPAGITSIGTNAFYGCAGLTAITFLGTPSGVISPTAFSTCNNLLVIRVPWASGAKTGAPWGATKATIIYNHTLP